MGCGESHELENAPRADKHKAVALDGVSDLPDLDVVVSFPGSFQNEWNDMVGAVELLKAAHPKRQFFSTCCVFLPEGNPHYGRCAPNDVDEGRSGECFCKRIYGRVAPWGCYWFKIWRSQLELALSRKQLPVVVYREGRVGQGDDLDWEDLPPPHPFSPKGLGPSQVAEVAYLRRRLGPEASFDKEDVVDLYEKNRSHADSYLRQLFHGNAGAWLLVGCIKKCEPARLGLRNLVLPDAGFGDDGGLALAQGLHTLQEIKDLEIGHSSFGDAASQQLAENIRHCRRLERLICMKNHLGETAGRKLAEALPNLPRLRQLNLAANDLGDEAGSAIIASLVPPCHGIESLCLEGNELGEAAAGAILEASQYWQRLEKLLLGSNCLGAWTERLAAALPNLLGVRYLELNDNGLSHAIISPLPRLPALETLDLSSNSLGEAAGRELAEALPACKSLKVLHIAAAGLGGPGGSELTRGLKGSRVRYLRANDNGFGDAAALLFAAALEECTELEVLLLGTNGFGDEAATAFASSFEACERLEKLGLDGNGFTAAGVEELKAAWRAGARPVGGLEPLNAVKQPCRNRGL